MKRSNKPKKIKKIKHISLKALHKKAWALKSEYIRRSEKGICFTCGVHKPWKEQQAGHYIHGDCMDFVELNIHCQCVRCNKWLSGNEGKYAERLILEYGLDAVLGLREIERERKAKTYKYTIFELENEILKYKTLLQELSAGKE